VYLGCSRYCQDVIDWISYRQQFLREIFAIASLKFPDDTRKAAKYIWRTVEDNREAFPYRLPEVRLTPHSATSVALTKLMMRLWFGEDSLSKPKYAPAAQENKQWIELLIGDESLQQRHTFAHVIDLGVIWQEITQLPFVFAVWQNSGPKLSTAIKKMILDAAEIAQARMRVEPSFYINDSHLNQDAIAGIDVANYWRCIQYRLTPVHLKSLSLFLCLARLNEPQIQNDDFVIKVTRLEQLAQIN